MERCTGRSSRRPGGCACARVYRQRGAVFQEKSPQIEAQVERFLSCVDAGGEHGGHRTDVAKRSRSARRRTTFTAGDFFAASAAPGTSTDCGR